MGLSVGEQVTTPSRTITADDTEALVRTGGYVVPLFTDADFAARSPFGRRPVPGPGLLLMMGGLVEQTGRFDDVVALVGFEDVRFMAPAFDGDEVRVEIEVTSRERRILAMRWRCLNQHDEELTRTTAKMLLDV